MDQELLTKQEKAELNYLREEKKTNEKAFVTIFALGKGIVLLQALQWVCSWAFIGANSITDPFHQAATKFLILVAGSFTGILGIWMNMMYDSLSPWQKETQQGFNYLKKVITTGFSGAEKAIREMKYEDL